MYKIYANDSLIFEDISPLESLKILEPKLTLEENAAGSLEFKLPPTNVGYNSIRCLTTELRVEQDGEEIWRGRVISEEKDFWNCKKYLAEGELAYLNDSVQPPKQYNVSNTNIRSFITSLLNTHNAQVGTNSNKRFLIGGVTVDDGDTVDDSDAIHRYTNYETTLKCINEKLVGKLGGHIRIRHSGASRYFDYFKDYSEIGSCDQQIRFGVNLLDFIQNAEATDWVTAIVPRGKRLEIEESEQPVPGLEAYTTIEDVATDGSWHTKGSNAISNPTAVSNYGYVSAVVDWDEVTDPAILYSKAKKYLQSVQFDKLCLEISAVDLHYLNPNIERFKLQETVHCISEVHGMDTSFPVTKIEIDLLNPSNTKYTLGTEVHTTLTSATNKVNDNLVKYVDDTFIPTESIILDNARDNATQLIEGAVSDLNDTIAGSTAGGYASFIYGLDKTTGNADIDQNPANPKKPQGLRVADAQKDVNAKNRWLWTTGGLGHYGRSKTSDPWGPINVAITMDGKVVADSMTVGMIKLTGAAAGQSSGGTGKSLFLKVYDGTTEVGRWGKDGIYIRTGSITLGQPDGDSRYPFVVDNDGNFQLTTWTNKANKQVANRWTSSSISITSGSITLGNPDGTGATDVGCKITSGGLLKAVNAVIKGNITATTGQIGYWTIKDGKLETTDSAQASLTKYYIGCGKAAEGIVNLRGASSTNTYGTINGGGQAQFSEDRKYGYVQISQSGDPNECRGGIRIYGNGHVVWFKDNGDASTDDPTNKYLSQIPDDLNWIIEHIRDLEHAVYD